MTFLEECLDGPFRVVTPSMLIRMPSYYSCDVCGKKSFKKFHDSQTETVPLDFVSKEKVVFIDDDFMIHMPPLDTCVWVKLRLHDDDSLPEQEPEQEPELPHLESPPEPLPLVETPEQQE